MNENDELTDDEYFDTMENTLPKNVFVKLTTLM